MSRPTLLRPTLLPGLRRLWRDRHTLQLGVDPVRAVVVELPDPAAARLLDLLDGSRTERSAVDQVVRAGVGEPEARALLDTLRRAGLVVGAHTLIPGRLPAAVRRRLTAEAAAIALRRGAGRATPAQILRGRAAARVVVTGRGRLAIPLAVALADAGVGQVSPALDGRVGAAEALGGALLPTDLRRPRSAAAADAIARAAPGTETRSVRRGGADLVIGVGTTGPAVLLAAAHARQRQAHLSVAVRDGTPVVGPLVPPAGSPCLNCLDLHRRDRDPAWPALAAQLAAPQPDAPDEPEPCSAPTVLAAAGFAAAEVLSYLDGGTPVTLGATVEIPTPGHLRRRTWSPHPGCDCRARRPERRTRRSAS